jgi:prophage tail gpP-like protein
LISIQIVSKGLIYDQWKEFEYHETLNAISNFFKASVTIGMDVNSTIPFSRGDELKLKIGNEVRLTGYIEDIYFDIHEQKSDIVIMGRSKTCDLVDSCIDLDTYEFSNISILKIASKICSQFGITVVDNIGASKTIVSKWNIIPTETAWECLERLSRKYGFLISGNSKGELVLGKSASLESKIDLTNETNIKRISGSSTYSNRFKKYRVYGQSRNQFYGH